MSVDFHAEFDLGPGFEGADRLCAQLATEPPGLRETVEKYRHRWRVSQWSVQPCRVKPAFTEVVGPGGFALTLSPVGASLYHLLRFSTFASDAEQRFLLRRSCAVIGSLLGSSRVLYMPELTPTGFFESCDLAMIEATLRREIGPPATNWQELSDASQYGPGSWYVETFAGPH